MKNNLALQRPTRPRAPDTTATTATGQNNTPTSTANKPIDLGELRTGFTTTAARPNHGTDKAWNIKADPAAAIQRVKSGCDAVDRDVVIVGAGPAGMMTAILLVQYGRDPERIKIVDGKSGPDQLSKATALQPGVFKILEQAGVLDEIKQNAVEMMNTEMYTLEGKLLTQFGPETDGIAPALAIAQNETERVLRNKLESLGVKIDWGTKVQSVQVGSDGTATAILDSGNGPAAVSARYLVGCDGINSTVRSELGIEFPGDRMPDLFSVFDATLEWDRDADHVHGWLFDGGMLYAVPLPGENRFRCFRVITEGKNPFAAGDEGTPGEEKQLLMDSLEKMGAKNTPEQAEQIKMGYFRVKEAQAETYSKGNAFLVGDAAHVHSPAGGQGMNTGLADAQNLAWKMARVLDGTANPAILKTYEQERRPIAKAVLRESGFATAFFSAGGLLGKIRNLLLPAMTSLMGKQLAAHEAQLDLTYRGFGDVKNDGPARGLSAGDPAPVDVATTVWGEGASTLAEVLAQDEKISDHVLLFDAPGRDVLLRKELAGALRTVKPHDHVCAHIVVDSDDEARRMAVALDRMNLSAGTKILVDPDETLRNAFKAKKAGLYVIRPDGYLGYRSDHLDGARLLRTYLRNDTHYPAGGGNG